ncbi:MAG: 5-formyltetrahydrofolate cyclo-ligase [Alphaproteobacteria bacterium]|nr:5-formyltetrahydrofolate cyclo-ligase [Alphaproteobacteria bacterium]
MARERREHFYARAGTAAARAVRDRFLARVPLAAGASVAGYFAFGSEFDPMPLMEALAARGHPLALPVVVSRAAPLVFRQWKPGDDLVEHKFGMREPHATQPQIEPDLLLVPLLAFDMLGHRIGYGGGFYDRTIAQLRAHKKTRAVGVAYSVQKVERVPVGKRDQVLDWIVTENEVIDVHEEARHHGWRAWWPW